MNKIDNQLKQIKDKVIDCQKCILYKTRILPVIGQGSHQADIMFIGEAPGAQESKTGIPFCGQAGKILDELLDSINIPREKVYIANILKDRPPANRNPLPDEIEACTPYLLRQIEIIKPKLVCTLGNYATAFILNKHGLADKVQGISKIHGQIFETGKFKVIPLYHPAVAVYNANMIEVLKKDFQALKK